MPEKLRVFKNQTEKDKAISTLEKKLTDASIQEVRHRSKFPLSMDKKASFLSMMDLAEKVGSPQRLLRLFKMDPALQAKLPTEILSALQAIPKEVQDLLVDAPKILAIIKKTDKYSEKRQALLYELENLRAATVQENPALLTGDEKKRIEKQKKRSQKEEKARKLLEVSNEKLAKLEKKQAALVSFLLNEILADEDERDPSDILKDPKGFLETTNQVFRSIRSAIDPQEEELAQRLKRAHPKQKKFAQVTKEIARELRSREKQLIDQIVKDLKALNPKLKLNPSNEQSFFSTVRDELRRLNGSVSMLMPLTPKEERRASAQLAFESLLSLRERRSKQEVVARVNYLPHNAQVVNKDLLDESHKTGTSTERCTNFLNKIAETSFGPKDLQMQAFLKEKNQEIKDFSKDEKHLAALAVELEKTLKSLESNELKLVRKSQDHFSKSKGDKSKQEKGTQILEALIHTPVADRGAIMSGPHSNPVKKALAAPRHGANKSSFFNSSTNTIEQGKAAKAYTDILAKLNPGTPKIR